MESIYDNTIMIVDDDVKMQDVVSDILEDTVSKIILASSGQEAIDLVKKEKVDLVVADLEMPNMHGLTMIEEISKVRPDMVFVVLTGFGDRNDVKRCIELGVYGFLDKPINDELLINLVGRGLDKVNSEHIQREMLEILLYSFSNEDPRKFQKMSENEQRKVLNGVLGLMKLKLLKSKSKED